MTYTTFMNEQRREYADLYVRYRNLRDNLPKRKDFQNKADWISSYYAAVVNMLKAFDYAGFIKRVSTITEFSPVDYAYMRLFNRFNNIPYMKEYVFFQDKGMIRESETGYRFIGFKLQSFSIDQKFNVITFRYADKIQKRCLYLDLGYITPSEYETTSLRIVPDPKKYKLKTREELLCEDHKYFEQVIREEY